ncbi:MAG: hypothetical protein USCAAHI_02708 [Beijerinckiaceae bacterium]|nr:MAG: hypothetical protein USCAAHI_02708 [Beijerinckiaceae bacterium]
MQMMVALDLKCKATTLIVNQGHLLKHHGFGGADNKAGVLVADLGGAFNTVHPPSIVPAINAAREKNESSRVKHLKITKAL